MHTSQHVNDPDIVEKTGGFQTSTFKDCVFEGDLTDVMFYRRGFQGGRYPPNEMINVDFRRAKLQDVSFRGLTLERVTLPDDEHHVVIEDYGAFLRDLVPTLRQQGDEVAQDKVGGCTAHATANRHLPPLSLTC